MLTKIGSLLKVALSAEFKEKIKTDRAFREAYSELNRAGGTGAQAEELFRKFYGGPKSGAGARSYTNHNTGFKSNFNQGFKDAGFADTAYEDLFKPGKNAKYKAGFASAGLGAYAAYKGYNYFKNRNMNRDAN